ncbi:MAG: glycosyltransferase family 2 protein [Verrucomicrobiota bacterium]
MISIVIPVYNEVDSLEALYQELCNVIKDNQLEAEIIMVDDGSTDESWDKIVSLAEKDARLTGLKFRRNFGKAVALDTAFNQANGEYVLTLDADLQDDPKELPRLLAKLQDGYDMVTGWKKQRHDPWHKVYPSRIFNWLVSSITGLKLHDHNCGFKAYRREVVKELYLYGELHRFITVMAHANGFRVAEIEVNHRPRRHGCSKYGIRRFMHGVLDLITVRFLTGYGDRPLHLMGFLGLAVAGIGLAGLGYLAMLRVLGEGIGNRPLLFYSLGALLLGGQTITFGMLAELIIWRSIRDGSSAGRPAITITKELNGKT